MNNNNALRKTLIAILAIVTVIILILVVKNMVENGMNQPQEEPASEEKVEIKSVPELISENKYSSIVFSEDGFIDSRVDVPLGGILQITNSTAVEVAFDIRSSDYVAALFVEAGDTGSSPVFTKSGEYTISILEDGVPNDEITSIINVVK